MNFEWDENKQAINLEKHGIDFEDVISLWNRNAIDPYGTRTSTTKFVIWHSASCPTKTRLEKSSSLSYIRYAMATTESSAPARRAATNKRLIVRRLDDARRGASDWAKLERLSDADIDAAIASDPDSWSEPAAVEPGKV
jgi:hypothetical protein